MPVSINGVGSISGLDQGFNVTTGSVGIGTDNPSNLLHVHGQSRFEDYLRGNSTHNKLYIADDVAITATKKLYFDGGSNTHIDEVSADTLRFSTAGTERLRITSNGNIGVGGATGTDYSLLDGIVTNTANGSAGLLINSSSSSHNAYMSFGYGSGSGTSHADQFSAYIGRVGDNTLILGTNNNITVRLDPSGRLLKSGQASLTSTTLSYPIQVAAASDANAIAIFGRAADDIGELAFYEADKTTKLGELQYRQDHLNFRHRVGDIRFATGGATERLRITSTGAIGIGSNFTAIETTGGGGITLDSGSGGGNIGVFLKSTSYTGNQTKLWQDSANAVSYLEATERPLIIKAGDGAGDYLRMDVAGSERLRITSDGKVGINDTSPASLFTVNNGTTDSQCVNIKNDNVGLLIGTYGTGHGSYPREATINGTRTDSGSSPFLRIAGQGGIKFCVDLNSERLRITSNGKFGFNTTSPAGEVHIKGNTDESANPSIILDDNGDSRRCYVTNSSGDLMLGGIDNGTVQSRLTIHENGNMYHQRLNSSGSLVYQFATYSSQVSGAASGNTYTEHMAFRGGSEGMRTGSFSMTIYGDGGDNYMPVLFIKHGYHPTNSSYGGQWFGEMWLNNSGSINPQNYNHTGYNNWATCSFKYRWDCAHWNAKPTLNMIEHYVNYGRTNIADLEISGTQSYFLIWLLPGIYRVTYSAWDGLNAWWTNNSNVGGALTHREGGGNTTRAVRAYSGRDTRYDSNISWGSQGQT